jgi:hypothetical protein
MFFSPFIYTFPRSDFSRRKLIVFLQPFYRRFAHFACLGSFVDDSPEKNARFDFIAELIVSIG